MLAGCLIANDGASAQAENAEKNERENNHEQRPADTSTWSHPEETSGAIAMPKPGRAGNPPPSKGVPIGGVRLSPEVSLTTRWDDNIYKTATNLRADVLTQLKTVIKVLNRWAQHQADLTYSATVRRYQVVQTENNVDQQISLNTKLAPSRLLDVELGYSRSFENDERGTPGKSAKVTVPGSTQPLGPNAWLQDSLRETARIKLRRLTTEIKLEQSDRSSQNNGQSHLDRYWFDNGILFRWALSPKTNLLLDMGRKETTYNRSPKMDSVETRLLTGVNWKVTPQTESQIKAGLTNKTMVNNQGKSSLNATWEANLIWQPSSRTRINLTSRRNTQDSEDLTESFIATTIQGNVDHTVSGNWHLLLGLENISNAYDTGKNEQFMTGKIGMEYRLSNHLVIATEVVNKTKDTTVKGTEFNSHAVQLSLTGSM
ncbi:MAG: outer membrane beta-barrel protein [Magnetococcales bacterium]|nr:outer membrane beta-barrel protein [Magnetococcales bacterium]